MDINSRVEHMDEELQLLKNEIKQVLLEIQEHVLNIQNPFTQGAGGMGDGFTASAPAQNEPVFTEPLVPEPEPVAPAPAPPVTEVNVTTQSEPAAPVVVAAPVVEAPVAAAPAAPPAVAPAGDFVPSASAQMPGPSFMGGGSPPGGMGGYSGPSYVPPPMPPMMPSMPFIPPSGGFGGPGFGGPTADWDARDRERDRADRDRDRADRDRDRDERERDADRNRGGDNSRDEDRNRGESDGYGERAGHAVGGPDDGYFQEGDADRSSRGDADYGGPPREFADIMAEMADDDGMPGLPPKAGPRKATGGQSRAAKSVVEDGGSLGPTGTAFTMPGLDLNGDSVGLVTMAGLIQWAYSVLGKVGSEHMFSILDVSARTGRIPEETRDILLSVIPIFEMAGLAENVTVKDIISTLAELDSFLGNISTEDARLLPFLLQEEMEVFPLIRPR